MASRGADSKDGRFGLPDHVEIDGLESYIKVCNNIADII